MDQRTESGMQAEIATLQRENARLQAEVTRLSTAVAAAVTRLAELEQQGQKPPGYVKPDRRKREGEQPPRKKRAAEHNTSRKRAEPTAIERHALERCPECQYELHGESVDYTREVIELPPPQAVTVTEHQVVKRWCPCCQAWRSPKLDLRGQVLGQGRIGVRLAGLVSYLRTSLRLPVREIQGYVQTLHAVHLSVGEIVALTHRVGRELEPQVEQLRVQAQASAVVHVDETGWREAGVNGYVWEVATAGEQALRYFAYHHSRSHYVPQGLLGLHFPGHVVSDFYAAYNLLRSPKQRCWVHLLRDLHELNAAHAETAAVLTWAQAVRQLYDTGCAWLSACATPTVAERQVQYDGLLARLGTLGEQYALDAKHPCQTLAKRLLRHQDELFQFVLTPGVPPDNNLAERGLRPLVIMRKISGGSRSPQGSKTRMALCSLFGTWTVRGLNPFFHCVALLQAPAAASP